MKPRKRRGPKGGSTGGDTVVDMVAIATRNASQSTDIARAASQVVAQRMALAMAAAFDPEKMQAFSAASQVALRQSDLAGRQMRRIRSNETAIANRAVADMIGCAGPACLAETQFRFASAWFERATATCIAMGMLALSGQAATMAPIYNTVVANANRMAR
jgi:hypothetical protein